MGALVGLIIMLFVIGVLIYGCAILAIVIGAAGWYLSFPVLIVITAGLIAWPIIGYRRLIRRSRWAGSFWYEEDIEMIIAALAIVIMWSTALREQISNLWDRISPYILR
jgi:hypothetical protein